MIPLPWMIFFSQEIRRKARKTNQKRSSGIKWKVKNCTVKIRKEKRPRIWGKVIIM